MSLNALNLPKPVLDEVIEQADLFYDGEICSSVAFNRIDRVALSTWHFRTGILNATREAFEARVEARMDADLAKPLPVSILASINDPEQWAKVLAGQD